MSNFITTNLRLPEEDYLRLKDEAARQRKSLSAVIRDKIGAKEKSHSKEEVERLMAKTRSFAKRNAKHLSGVDIINVIREMRKNG